MRLFTDARNAEHLAIFTHANVDLKVLNQFNFLRDFINKKLFLCVDFGS
jgi:hypothetical protein